MGFEPLQEELKTIAAEGLLRSWKKIEKMDGGRIQVAGRWFIHLASNSYLGLHQHPKVIAAAGQAAQEYGTGAGSARLIGGTFSLHERLEEKLAVFKQAQAALVFPTGYMANLGCITALVGPGDLVIGDHLNHASLIDACRLSRATFRVYPHKDVARLEAALRARRKIYRRTLLVTEGLFSMDGDIAPLREIAAIAQKYEAWLLIDDAHATGVLGPEGRGSLEHCGISTEGIIQMGTLSKALGSLGGFIAGPKVVIDLLKNKARSFIYTTALPPASVAAAVEALQIIQQEPRWRTQLWKNVKTWISGFNEMNGQSIAAEGPIVPLVIGDSLLTMEMAQRLLELGVYAPGIRPPTVPPGSARIRVSLTALHTERDLTDALDAFRTVFKHTTAQVDA